MLKTYAVITVGGQAQEADLCDECASWVAQGEGRRDPEKIYTCCDRCGKWES